MDNKKKDILEWLKNAGIGMVGGALVGVAVVLLAERYGMKNLNLLIVVAISFIVLLFVQIILHEAGHMITGLLTGYKLASFRVGSYLFKKENGKWVRRRYNIPGTGGQCLMAPPEKKGDKFPFVWYNLGGVFMNFLLGVISLLLIIAFKNMNSIMLGICIGNLTVSIFILLTNAIPMKAGGVPNDGYNVMALCKDKRVREVFYLELSTYELVLHGTKWSEIPQDLFDQIDLEPENCFYVRLKMMEYNRYLDTHKFEKCKAILDDLLKYKNNMAKMFALQVDAEAMFLELISEGQHEVIESFDSAELRKFLKTAKYIVGFQRVQYAYDLLYKKDKEKADKLYPHLDKLIKENPVLGEVELEQGLFDVIQEKYNSMDTN